MSKDKNQEIRPSGPGENAGFFKRRPVLAVALIYFVALIILFFPVLSRPFNSPDSVSQAYPIYSFNKAYIARYLTLPFWFPYINGGNPFLKGMHPNFLFDLFVYLFPIELGIGYRAMIFVFLSGLLAYLFFRSLGLGKGISTVAGLAYMMTGATITYTTIGHYGKVVNLAFLPLALLCINAAFRNRQWIYFIFAALPVSFMFRGHPQVFYYNMGILTLYILFRIFYDYKETKDKKRLLFFLGGYALMGVVSVLLCFDNLYHQVEFVGLTSRGAAIDPAQRWQFATSWSAHPLEILTYFIPSLFGLKDQTYLGWKPFVSATDYAGLAVFLIALWSVVVNWKRREVKLFAFVLVAGALYGFGHFFPAYFKIFYNYFPMIKSFRVPSTIYAVLSFYLVYLFALGLKSLGELDWKDPKQRKSVQVFITAVIAVLFILTVFINSGSYAEMLKNNLGMRIDLKALYSRYDSFQVDNYIKNITRQTSDLASGDLKNAWIFSLVLIVLVFFFVRRRIKAATFFVILGLLVAVDLYITNSKFVAAADNYDIVSKETDEVTFLKGDKSKFRIMPFPPQIDNESNKWCLFGIESAFGYNAISLKLYDDILKAGLLHNLKFLSLFNVKYLVTGQEFVDPGIEKVHQGRKIIYLNKSFLPRYFHVPSHRVIPKEEDALNLLRSGQFDPQREVILQEDPQVPQSGDVSASAPVIEPVQYDPDVIRFKVRFNRPGFLFLSEVYYPDWECFVNGSKVKIYRANYLFRAVYLKEGEHDVLFQYHNSGFYLFTVLLTLTLTIGLIIFMLSRRKRYFPLD